MRYAITDISDMKPFLCLSLVFLLLKNFTNLVLENLVISLNINFN